MKIPHMTTNTARTIAGGGMFLLTVIVFLMIYTKPELADNDLFATLAQGIVLTGFISLVMSWLFTSSSNRTSDTRIVNRPDEPIPTQPSDGSDQDAHA